MTVRASGLVLVNNHSGYMGRPVIDETFTLDWRDESALGAATDPASVEKLALARKARRIFYPSAPRARSRGRPRARRVRISIGCYDGFPRLADPLSPGPALRLRPGYSFIAAAGVIPGTPAVARDTTLTFVTSSGFIPTSRQPTTGGALPSGVAVVDLSLLDAHKDDAVRFYVPYADDQVFEFTADRLDEPGDEPEVARPGHRRRGDPTAGASPSGDGAPRELLLASEPPWHLLSWPAPRPSWTGDEPSSNACSALPMTLERFARAAQTRFRIPDGSRWRQRPAWSPPGAGSASSSGAPLSCDVVLAGRHVSRAHAALVRRPDGWWVEDLGSRNGVLCEGERVARRRLVDGDVLLLGDEAVRCRLR